ncbi:MULTISPECIES: hypothetical protein [Cellulomonas]|uniref:hypothetical protein n=1 Tax=Cellulomonas TaxID=1707 RepID=UPI001FE47178|nr:MULTISPECIES: hypothetical protein [Cellulomonas]
MIVVVLVVLLVLLAAVAVLLLARVSSDDAPGGFESPWQAFRRGLRARRAPETDEALAAAVQLEPQDVSLADFLRANVRSGDGYVDVEELTEDLHRVAQTLRVRRGA